MIIKFIKLVVISFGFLITIGCGGGSDTNSITSNDINKDTIVNGRVVDGEIRDATVFLDINRNGLLDSNEPSTKSNKEGYFRLSIDGEYATDFTLPIVSTGGFDIRANSAYEETLMAFRAKDSNSSLIITPLSTLIANDVLVNLTSKDSKKSRKILKITPEELFVLLENAQNSFAKLFNISTEVITKDPIELALDSKNLDLLKTDMKINRVAKEIKKAINQDVKDAKTDAIESFRALSKALKEAQKEAKNGDEALVDAIDYIAKVEPNIFNVNMVSEIKQSTQTLLDNFNQAWDNNEDSILEALQDSRSFEEFNEDSNNSSQTTDEPVVDTTPPTITLKGDNPIILEISQNYIEYGATALDNIDGNISSEIEIKNSVVNGVEGNYSVIYSVVDSANNSATVTRLVIIKDRLKALDTQTYKEKWFDKAKAIWNSENPDNPYNYNYYSYSFPKDGDRVAGTPPDTPILPKEWMQTAGLGFSKFLKYPFEESRYQYTDAQVKEWKSKGFRNGRLHVPLYEMVDLYKDPTGATLKESDLQKIKDICQIFVDNNIPITISIVSGDSLSDNMKDDREETFRRTIEWWRQLSSYFKDMSYLVAFENYVEYHGFDNVEIEKRTFKIKVDNNETHYSGFVNYRNWAITNWVRTPGYNNLMAEIARVVRVTNPKRIMIYKPTGIGRTGMVNITPWRWGSEADYLGINNKNTPYWLISSGGSANLNFDYIKATRTNNQDEKDTLLASAKKGTWGPALNYYNATKVPVWISLFGIKADDSKVSSELGGVDVTTDELVDYINWYQGHIQSEAKDENNQTVKISSGFQQAPWVWDFKNQTWFVGRLNDRWDNFERIGEVLSIWAKKFPQ